MCKLQGINFGYADSEKELLETPELFDSAFIDPKNVLSKLMYGLPFLVLGRKGSGKTAYGAKIRRIAMVDEDIIVQPCPLSNLNYSSFESYADQKVSGGRRFLSVWKYLLLLEMIKLVDKSFPDQEYYNLEVFISALKQYGILPIEDIVHVASHLDTTNVSLNIPNIFSLSKGADKSLVISGIDEITEMGLSLLHETNFGEKHFYLIIDGLDDALRGEKFSSDIITGLIRAAESINMELYHSQIHFKVIILLRSDIFELCRDPDITKLKRDVTINLSWTKDDLKNIVLWRIKGKYPQYKSFDDFWYAFAPELYKGKRSSPLLMELTLLRPRDILQFFLECQDLYGERDTISYSELSTTIASYSKNYLISEMKDELTGIIPDEIITAIPYIFSELGRRMFQEKDLQEVISSNEYSISARKLLSIMFSIGYIGQVRHRNRNTSYISFIHINPFDKYVSNDSCIIHRGLIKAFNILQ